MPQTRFRRHATNRNTLQHSAAHCSTLQLTATHCNSLQHTATVACRQRAFDDMLCMKILKSQLATKSALQNNRKADFWGFSQMSCCQFAVDDPLARWVGALQHTATHCYTLQLTATHCNTLQQWHAANSLSTTLSPDELVHCNTLQHTATHCHTLPHTATHYNALQHNAT